jgi:virginiamycin B lyase
MNRKGRLPFRRARASFRPEVERLVDRCTPGAVFELWSFHPLSVDAEDFTLEGGIFEALPGDHPRENDPTVPGRPHVSADHHGSLGGVDRPVATQTLRERYDAPDFATKSRSSAEWLTLSLTAASAHAGGLELASKSDALQCGDLVAAPVTRGSPEGCVSQTLFVSLFSIQHTTGTDGVARTAQGWQLQEYPVPAGSRPHDVAPAPNGSVWYTAQGSGQLGNLDPATGKTRHIFLGAGSAPHGVIVGPDGAPWITDGGLNAIVRVDPKTDEVQVYPLPAEFPNANLNTATFDARGILWFTGQNGMYGRLDPSTGEMTGYAAPRGRGPYGMTTTPTGEVYYASLAGNHIARIDVDTGEATVIEPPTPGQGARRVWSDSLGRIWVSEWNVGQLGVYDPAKDSWREWSVPSGRQAYAVFVDEHDQAWVSDWGANSLARFDPATETFEVFPIPTPISNVRQLLGRAGEVWGAESAANKLVVIRMPT